jgi:hypothetical protein
MDGLTREHVFGDWLTRIGLDLGPVAQGAGPLNRLLRDMGVNAPFRQTVRDVCDRCNGGWMSRLEGAAKRVLTPFILGQSGSMEPTDQGAVAAWVQKTALVAMLVSSEKDRNSGYGLPSTEYREMFERRDSVEPLPATDVWIGRYRGQGRTGTVWVTPLVVAVEGTKEPDWPQAYAMTLVLGELLLHGVSFTTPSLELQLSTLRGFSQLWPAVDRVTWPNSTSVDDAGFVSLSGGRELLVTEPHVSLRPWKPATDLADSRSTGSMVELPTLCGEHVVYYPQLLVREAMRGRFCMFTTSCECGKAYLMQAQHDGVHCKEVDTPEAIAAMYEELPGMEYEIADENGRFYYKRMS